MSQTISNQQIVHPLLTPEVFQRLESMEWIHVDESRKVRSSEGCGGCQACRTNDCGQCDYCLDMKKYGGPNKLRQHCINRQRSKFIVEGGVPSSNDQKKIDVVKKNRRNKNHKRKLQPFEKLEELAAKHLFLKSSDTHDVIDHLDCPALQERKMDPMLLFQSACADEKKYRIVTSENGPSKRLKPVPNKTSRPSLPSPPKLRDPISNASTIKSLKKTNVSTSCRVYKKKIIPKSLPFLAKTAIANVIVEFEIRAKNFEAQESSAKKFIKISEDSCDWKLDEMVNFFRAIYLFGWGEWDKIQKFIRTKTDEEIKTLCRFMLKKYHNLKRFFCLQNLNKLHKVYSGVKIKRVLSRAAAISDTKLRTLVTTALKGVFCEGLENLSIAATEVLENQEEEEDTDTEDDADVDNNRSFNTFQESDMTFLENPTLSFSAETREVAKEKFNNGKVIVHLGTHTIKSDINVPPLTDSFSESHLQSDDVLFDSKYRPIAPIPNCPQIFIPGSRVYARWMMKNDPGSFGTWYSGIIESSRVSSEVDNQASIYNIPKLLYSVRFDDGVSSKDILAEDIMIQSHYESWLKTLEDYYALPVMSDVKKLPIAKGESVFAVWVDPTDPDMHARWVHGSVKRSFMRYRENRLQFCYHVLFDDGDEDECLREGSVLLENTYKELLQQKIENSRNSAISGFDLIHAASKIASPVKISESRDMMGMTSVSINDNDDDKSRSSSESDQRTHLILDSKSSHYQGLDSIGIDNRDYTNTDPRQITPSYEPPQEQVTKICSAFQNGTLSSLFKSYLPTPPYQSFTAPNIEANRKNDKEIETTVIFKRKDNTNQCVKNNKYHSGNDTSEPASSSGFNKSNSLSRTDVFNSFNVHSSERALAKEKKVSEANDDDIAIKHNSKPVSIAHSNECSMDDVSLSQSYDIDVVTPEKSLEGDYLKEKEHVYKSDIISKLFPQDDTKTDTDSSPSLHRAKFFNIINVEKSSEVPVVSKTSDTTQHCDKNVVFDTCLGVASHTDLEANSLSLSQDNDSDVEKSPVAVSFEKQQDINKSIMDNEDAVSSLEHSKDLSEQPLPQANNALFANANKAHNSINFNEKNDIVESNNDDIRPNLASEATSSKCILHSILKSRVNDFNVVNSEMSHDPSFSEKKNENDRNCIENDVQRPSL